MSSVRIGDVLGGAYRIDRLLGSGGVGAVYLATHLHLHRAVAVKVLHPNCASQDDALQRFELEARILGQLGHPAFVSVYHFAYTPEKIPFLVMEFIEGETLRSRVSRQRFDLSEPAEQAALLSLFAGLCAALDQAHAQQILHRDLKPDNVMILGSGGVKILDFGMAKLLSDAAVVTEMGMVMGTPNYLSPERVRGKAADRRADVFALGLMLYEALTGQMAYHAESALATMYMILESAVPSIDLLDRRLTRRVDHVIATACARDPAQRYATCGALYDALAVALRPPEQVEAPDSGVLTLASTRSPIAAPTAPVRTLTLEEGQSSGRDIKAMTARATLEFIRVRFGVSGYLRLQQDLGATRLRALEEALLTSWVDAAELEAIHDAVLRLFDDGTLEVMRDMGRYVASVALATVYRALLSDQSLQSLPRRLQVLAAQLVRPQSTRTEIVGEGQVLLEVRGWRVISAAWLAARAGWLERYLEMAGASNAHVEESLTTEGDETVARLLLCFQEPAQVASASP